MRLLQTVWMAVLLTATTTHVGAAPASAPAPAAGPTGIPADASRLKHAAPLTLYPGTTFRGDSSCSPHSPTSFLTVGEVGAIPALELPGPALRFWRAVPTGEGEVTNVTWFDLTSGAVILANPAFNATTSTRGYTYTILGDNAVDRPARAAALGVLRAAIARLAAGQRTGTDPATGQASGYTCNTPQPALDGLVTYLDGVLGASTAAAGAPGGELRPREEAVGGGRCIAEAAALYDGPPLPGAAGAPAPAATLEECCDRCAASPGCALFTWCPITAGCEAGAGGAPRLAYLACALKAAPAGGVGGPPPGAPPAGVRGPPVLAMSGRLGVASA